MLFSTKQPLRHSKVLTVDQILWMHCMLDSADTDAVDKSIFAYLLTALYGRCRHSDLANIESIHEDWDCNGGFLEIRTRTHKTGKSAASKTVLLPIVIPAVGVHGKPWIGEAKKDVLNRGADLQWNDWRAALQASLKAAGVWSLCAWHHIG